jgi:hypothetical protein
MVGETKQKGQRKQKKLITNRFFDPENGYTD